MFTAKISDYFVNDSGVFYLLSEKLDMAPIFNRPLNRRESLTEARDHWNVETHWLAVFGDAEPFEGYFSVSFDFSSTTFHKTMKHGTQTLYNVRNINVISLKPEA